MKLITTAAMALLLTGGIAVAQMKNDPTTSAKENPAAGVNNQGTTSAPAPGVGTGSSTGAATGTQSGIGAPAGSMTEEEKRRSGAVTPVPGTKTPADATKPQAN